MKSVFIIISLCFSVNLKAQTDTSVILEQDYTAVHVSKDFERKYKKEYDRIRKIYPLALKASELIDEFDSELSGMEKKRKKKKYGKEAHKMLKEEFTYAIKELYTSEGVLLMKLINRETGRTVSEIVKDYRGGLTAGLYESMGKLWDQDLDIIYDPKGTDWLTEMIIKDIENEQLAFEAKVEKVTKEHYKEDRKAYKKSIREYRRTSRKAKRTGK